MSYDIDLVRVKRKHKAEIGNYTGNVSGMWSLALGFDLEAFNGMEALDAIEYLKKAVGHMRNNPKTYKAMNPTNGWGDYEGALQYLERLLSECKKHPKCIIEISC